MIIQWLIQRISTTNWPSVGGFAQAVEALVVLVAVVVAFRHLREARKSRILSLFLPIYQNINSLEAKAQRKVLFEKAPIDVDHLTNNENLTINEIVSQFDFLGFLLKHKVIEKSLIRCFYYGMVIRTWDCAWPYIMNQRKIRGAKYAQYFELLAKDCKNYLNRKRSDEFIRVHHEKSLP